MSKGHGGGGPAIVRAPDPEMKTIEQSNALSAQKRRQGLLSTLLGSREVEEEDKGNATALTGKEYLNSRDEYIQTTRKPTGGFLSRVLGLTAKYEEGLAKASAAVKGKIDEYNKGKKKGSASTSSVLGEGEK